MIVFSLRPVNAPQYNSAALAQAQRQAFRFWRIIFNALLPTSSVFSWIIRVESRSHKIYHPVRVIEPIAMRDRTKWTGRQDLGISPKCCKICFLALWILETPPFPVSGRPTTLTDHSYQGKACFCWSKCYAVPILQHGSVMIGSLVRLLVLFCRARTK